MFKFSDEINGREITSKVNESVIEKTDYQEAIRREPSGFMMQEVLRDAFMVLIVNSRLNILKINSDSFLFLCNIL